MKKIILSTVFLILSLSCKNDNKNTIVEEKNEIPNIEQPNIEDKHSQIDITLLNGIWAEDEDENAMFEINDDTIRYVEHYETPYTYLIQERNLIVIDEGGEPLPKSEIIKLTRDSLILKSVDGSLLKLYKRE